MSASQTLAHWWREHSGLLPVHELEILAQEAYFVQLGAQAEVTPRIGLGELRMQAAHLELVAATRALLAEWVRARQGRGLPLQHITGFQEFHGHRYGVSPATLIPRPETEVLVSEVLRAYAQKSAPRRIVEIGTGTGVIAIELLRVFSQARAVVSDVSTRALELAVRNAQTHLGAGVERFEAVQSRAPLSVWDAFSGQAPFDCVVSNPPYLVAGVEETTAEVAAHEPASALFAPEGDPLFFYREILQMPRELRADGVEAWLEVPHERASEIFALALELGWQAELGMDLTGRPRILRASTGQTK